MPLMHGSERCHCGHSREHHLQRSRERTTGRVTVRDTRGRCWVDVERDPAPKLKLAGCLLCACGGFAMKRSRTL